MNSHVYRTPVLHIMDIIIMKEVATSKERRKEIYKFIN